MPVKWKSTTYPGVRYYEHETRRHGVPKDRYFAIRYQKDGVRKEEGLGWSTQGWTAQKASFELARLKQAQITGDGPTSLKEKRELARAEKHISDAERERLKRESITFGDFFHDTYLPQSRQDKNINSYKREDALFRHWIEPIIGGKPFKEISPIDIEKIKMIMKQTQSPRSIQYALAVVRQGFNLARRNGVYEGESPTKKVKQPTINNRRQKFLKIKEVEKLLAALKSKSPQVYEMALISVQCGLRFSEIASLKWGDIELELRHIVVKNPKNGKSRIAFMTDAVRGMFDTLKRGNPDDLVFPDRNGIRIVKISRTFDRTVEELEFNKGITDPRDRVVFHTLRHTYASLLVERGIDLYTVKELLGHSTLAMTERYSHVGQNALQSAVKKLDMSLSKRSINLSRNKV